MGSTDLKVSTWPNLTERRWKSWKVRCWVHDFMYYCSKLSSLMNSWVFLWLSKVLHLKCSFFWLFLAVCCRCLLLWLAIGRGMFLWSKSLAQLILAKNLSHGAFIVCECFIISLYHFVFVLRSHVKVNCWFCGLNTRVLKQCRDGWICKHCEQYNGFKSVSWFASEVSIPHFNSIRHLSNTLSIFRMAIIIKTYQLSGTHLSMATILFAQDHYLWTNVPPMVYVMNAIEIKKWKLPN